MLNVIKEQKGNVLAVRLSGSIEESVNFDQLNQLRRYHSELRDSRRDRGRARDRFQRGKQTACRKWRDRRRCAHMP